MGRDYPNYAVESDDPLSEALQSALPTRFDGAFTGSSADSPWGYGRALLEGAVASATRAGEPYDVASPSVRRVVDDFIEKIQSVPTTTILQVATDIDVSGSADAGATSRLCVAGVNIIPARDNIEAHIEQELLAAGYALWREDGVAWPRPAALLVARVRGMASPEARLHDAFRRLRNVTTAVRLATGASTFPVVTITGEPGIVRAHFPHVQIHAKDTFRVAHRPVTLTGEDVAGLEDLSGQIDTWLGDEPWLGENDWLADDDP